MLPDDVLLAIFDFCIGGGVILKEEVEAWQSLVHVCRQWRTVVFGSSRRLNLQLFCSTETQKPLRGMLDVWPTLPLVIDGDISETEELDNTIAVLERSDRVCYINLADFSSYWETISAAMQKPFPKLTDLQLSSSNAVTVVPDSFLDGSAPRLKYLWLDGIPFPGLPKLLLFASRLLVLHLSNIPHSGYFSPEAIVTALSTMTNLGFLTLEFQSPRFLLHGQSRRPPPPTRTDLPILRQLMFKGVSEYLEDLVARINAPRLFFLDITLFNQIVFDAPQFAKFISRTPKFKVLEDARLAFTSTAAGVTFLLKTAFDYGKLVVNVSCRDSDWQVSSLEQVCTSCLPPFSALEDLRINEDPESPPDWQDNIENTLWLELLHPFSAVKNLYLSEIFAPRIAPALQELVGARTTEVLPILQNIFLEGLEPSGPAHEGIVEFAAARQLSGHPIMVSFWERDT